MRSRFPLRFAALTALLAAATVSAPAQEAGDFQLRIGGAHIATDTDSNDLVFEGTALDNFRGDVDDATSGIFNLTYFITPNWGVELLAAAPFKHDIEGDGELMQLGTLGNVSHLPPTLSLQYHFLPGQTFRPYVGAGVNYTLFFDDDASQSLHEGIVATANNALGTDFSGGSTRLDVDDSVGPALQVGIDMQVTENWFTNIDIRYILIDADADLRTDTFDAAGAPVQLNSSLDMEIDPWVFGWAFGFRF